MTCTKYQWGPSSRGIRDKEEAVGRGSDGRSKGTACGMREKDDRIIRSVNCNGSGGRNRGRRQRKRRGSEKAGVGGNITVGKYENQMLLYICMLKGDWSG